MSKESVTDMRRGVYRRIYSGATRGERINKLTGDQERLFWRLNMICDDFGNFRADPVLLKADALPLVKAATPGKIRKWLDAIADTGLACRYSSDGDDYGHIVGFEELQPAGRNGKRIQRHPMHPGESGCIQGNPGESSFIVRPETEDESETEDHSDTDTETEDEANTDSLSVEICLGSDSVSDSAAAPGRNGKTPHSRDHARQLFAMHVSLFWAKSGPQSKSDRTDTENLFDDVVWPEESRAGPERYRLALALIDVARKNGRNKMAYFKQRVTKELSETCLG